MAQNAMLVMYPCSPLTKNVYVAWILVALPLLSSGIFYATFVLQISVPTIDLLAVITPTALLPILSIKSAKGKPSSVTSNVIFATVVVGSYAILFAPGAATLQLVLLLPIFACVDIAFKATRF